MARPFPSPSALADELASDAGPDRDEVLAAVTREVMQRARASFPDHTVDSWLDEDSGHLDLYLVFAVVSSVRDPGREISLETGRGVDPDVGVGDELMFQVLSRGESMMPSGVACDEALERSIRGLPELYAQALADARDSLRA